MSEGTTKGCVLDSNAGRCDKGSALVHFSNIFNENTGKGNAIASVWQKSTMCETDFVIVA